MSLSVGPFDGESIMSVAKAIGPSESQNRADSEPVAVSKLKRRTWKGFVRDVVVYVGVYILISGIAIGPLFWQWHGSAHVDGPKWVAKLFLPLAILCELFPPLGWLVNAWINWWIL